MKLSPNFSMAEWTVTNTGLQNIPLQSHAGNLQLTAFGLEQVRAILGNQPLTITSGYRSPSVNRAVGGVSNSDHALGFAADFKHHSLSALTAFKILRDSTLVFDQLIIERNDSLLHISFAPRLRGQVMRQPGGPGSPIEQLERK